MSPQGAERGSGMVSMRRSLVAVVVTAVMTPLLLSACGDKGDKGDKKDASIAAPARSAPVTESAVAPVSLTLTPAAGKKNVPVSAEIGLKVSGGKVSTVTLTDSKGKAVSGGLRDDGSAWVPSKPLKTKQRYAASVVATAADGSTKTATTSFTTMGAPAHRTGTGLYLFDDHTYGVAMPVVAEFSPGIKKADRAAVQKRMFVKTDPPQPGTWSWTSSGTQAFYRAPKFWQPGTKLTVRLALGGLPTGGGRYGDRD